MISKMFRRLVSRRDPDISRCRTEHHETPRSSRSRPPHNRHWANATARGHGPILQQLQVAGADEIPQVPSNGSSSKFSSSLVFLTVQSSSVLHQLHYNSLGLGPWPRWESHFFIAQVHFGATRLSKLCETGNGLPTRRCESSIDWGSLESVLHTLGETHGKTSWFNSYIFILFLYLSKSYSPYTC